MKSLVLTLALLAAPPAFAHAHLENSTPAAGTTVAAPAELRLAFSEGVEPRVSKVALTGPGGAVALGAASVEASHPDVLVVPIAKPLAPGAYTVKWRAVSVDSHATQGSFAFTVK